VTGTTASAGREAEHPWSACLRTLREAPRRRTLAAGGAALFSLLVYFVVRHLLHVSMVDMIVYRAEGSAVANNQDLYGFRVTQWNLPATYPPFAALFFTPTAWMPVPLLRVLVTAFNVGLIGLFAHFSFRLAGWPRREWRPAGVLLAAGFGVWLEPVWTTLRYGQINLLLGCLVLWDLTRPDRHRGKGIGIGLAAGLKLTPALFAVYLLLTGRVRAAFTAAATGLGTVLLGWLVLPRASVDFWSRTSSTPAGSARSGSSTTSRCAVRSAACCTPPTPAPPRSSPPPWWPSSGSRSRWAPPAAPGGCRARRHGARCAARSPGCSSRRSAGRTTGSGCCR
jgi:hypothetical protein